MDPQERCSRLQGVTARGTDVLDLSQRTARLGDVLALGVEVGPGAAGCSVTVMVGAGFRTLAGSTSTAWALDAAQYHTGRGPCVAAARTGMIAGFDVDDDGGRFPGLAAAAAARRVRCVLSMPPPGPGHGLAVNIYSTARHAFTDPNVRDAASLLASCVADILDNGQLPAAGPTGTTGG